MSHVSRQLSDAVTALVRELPGFDGHVYGRGAYGWDRRTYPMAVVNVGAATVATQQSGSRRSSRLQDRRQTVVIEIHDLEREGEDPLDRLTELVAAVEAAMCSTALERAVPIDDITLNADTGATEIDGDEDGAHVAQALTFSVTYHTVEGDPSRFVEPNR